MYVHHMIRHIRVSYCIMYHMWPHTVKGIVFLSIITVRHGTVDVVIKYFHSYYVLRIAYGTYVRTVLPVSFIIPYCMLNMCDVWAAEV